MENEKKDAQKSKLVAAAKVVAGGLLALLAIGYAVGWVTLLDLGLIALIVILLAISCWLFVFIVQKWSERDFLFTTVKQGYTAFIMAGGNLLEFWPNIGGYRKSYDEDLDGRRWVIADDNEEKCLTSLFRNSSKSTLGFQKWLWKTFGVRFISIFVTSITKLQFKVDRRELLNETQVTHTTLEGRVVYSKHKDEPVSELLFLAPRPVFVPGVELAGDNSRVDMILLCVYQQVIPALSVIYLRGDFYSLLDAAIKAAMVELGASHRVAVYKETKEGSWKEGEFVGDFCPVGETEKEQFREWYNVDFDEHCKPAPLTYQHWLKLAQSGPKSALERFLRPLNFTPEFYYQLWGEKEEMTEAEKDEKESGKLVLRDKPKKEELIKFIDSVTNNAYREGVETYSQDLASKLHIAGGIVQRFGFMLKSVRLVDRAPDESTLALAEALLAKETAFHTAEGVRAEAAGERDRLTMVGTGEKNRFDNLVAALTERGIEPSQAADVVSTVLRTENIGRSKITTYVEGNAKGRTSVLVNPEKETNE